MNRLGAVVTMFFAVCLLAGLPVGAQTEPSPDAARYSQDELDQLLAPIALYPDQLVTQILIAATYPFEVVQAARFVQQNPNLTGDALDEALAQRNWDPSVQSLAAFPQVLAMMDDRLDWTQRLGDAFLADQQRVMDTVQALRKRAEAAGNLQSTPQQRVIAQDNTIVIEPAQSDVIYVPVYDPVVVYGPWWAPGFPPWFWYPPPIYGYPVWPVFGVGIWFGGGYRVSHHHWDWSHPDWHGHHVTVDPTRSRFWNHRGSPPLAGSNWQHSPEHRRGVAYPDPATRDRFTPVDPNAVRAREPFRGHDLVPPAGIASGARPNVSLSGAGRSPAPAGPAQPSPSAPSAMAPPVTRQAPTTPAIQSQPSVASPEQARPTISLPGPQARPSISSAAPQARPIAPPAASIFDPGVSRQQAQINAQRGIESRRSTISPPPAMSRPPSPPPMTNRAPASQGVMRAPAPSGATHAPAPAAGGRASAPTRSR